MIRPEYHIKMEQFVIPFSGVLFVQTAISHNLKDFNNFWWWGLGSLMSHFHCTVRCGSVRNLMVHRIQENVSTTC